MTTKSSKRRQLTRRQALRLAAGAAGGLALAGLPAKWTKPVVKAGALPASAAASCPITLTIDLIDVDGGQGSLTRVQGPVASSVSGGTCPMTL